MQATVYVQSRCGEAGPFYLAGRGAARAILFTSGRIDPETVRHAADRGILVIDREKLIRLMIDHGVGVSNETIKVPHLRDLLPSGTPARGRNSGGGIGGAEELPRSEEPEGLRKEHLSLPANRQQ
jgi:hypothetical protein